MRTRSAAARAEHADPQLAREPESKKERELVSSWEVIAEIRYAHVHGGYRKGMTIGEAFVSAFTLHNDTVNVWTHVTGLAIFAWLLVSTASLPAPGGGVAAERWPLHVYSLSALACLATSSTYHVFGTANERWTRPLGKLDYCGIVALIVGSCVAPIHFGFASVPAWRRFYLTLMSVLGLALVGCCQMSWFYLKEWRLLRIGLFVGLGAACAAPLLHLLPHRRFDAPTVELATGVGWTLGTYLIGVVFYATGVPESLAPGRFDYFAASHQWWHVCVVVAALLQHDTLVRLWAAASLAQFD